MKSKSCILFTALFVFRTVISTAIAEDYKIGAGDVLDIGVWKNVDLTR